MYTVQGTGMLQKNVYSTVLQAHGAEAAFLGAVAAPFWRLRLGLQITAATGIACYGGRVCILASPAACEDGGRVSKVGGCILASPAVRGWRT